ncbi:hypothetical protein O181_044668 [Austropuccinia psidii MF-1]|uniref:Uncharacterized protein n=1 Tax=Austropuccinia psidii MF-1 TaxID=1389203 RepID=A0A9Q3HGU8_9BASI|nr:hypothetical protein [Austropuccinia psidii MF-1]
MAKFCQRQRLQALKFKKSDPEDNPAHEKLEINNKTYIALLKYLQQRHPNLHDFSIHCHPLSSLVLQKFAINLKSINWIIGLKLSTERPNSCIKFRSGSNKKFGRIMNILDLRDPEVHAGPLIVLEEYEIVSHQEHDFEQVKTFLNGLELAHVVPNQRLIFVAMNVVMGLAAYLQLPAWLLGCIQGSFLLWFINKFVGLERKEGSALTQ